ncbi:MAG: type IV pilin [Candidatus Syntrophoarchaeum sp. WYZ-LMO15]|nr:MAG: type IV pilin [Candidatus Syntrophoarchaeum sp. WYZ-LMO15]
MRNVLRGLGKGLKGFAEDVKALSPVVAVLLLVAITVIAAAGMYVWYGGMAGSAGSTTEEKTGGALSTWWERSNRGLEAPIEVALQPASLELVGPTVEIPEWKPEITEVGGAPFDPANDTQVYWPNLTTAKYEYGEDYNEDNNELCGCCDAIGVYYPPRGVLEEDGYLNTYEHEGGIYAIKATVKNTGTSTAKDVKIIVPETPHDNCWWLLHAIETDEGLVWVKPGAEAAEVPAKVTAYFGVNTSYEPAKIAAGVPYAKYSEPQDNAGIHYVFDGVRIAHVPLGLDFDYSVYKDPLIGGVYGATDEAPIKDTALKVNDTVVGPGLEKMDLATTPTAANTMGQGNLMMPYLTYKSGGVVSHLVAVVDDPTLLGNALDEVGGWTLADINGTDDPIEVGDKLLVDTVALVVNEDEIKEKYMSPVYELGDIAPGETKEVWIILVNRHFAVEDLGLPSFREGASWDLPIQIYAGGEQVGEMSYRLYLKDTGKCDVAHI